MPNLHACLPAGEYKYLKNVYRKYTFLWFRFVISFYGSSFVLFVFMQLQRHHPPWRSEGSCIAEG